MSPEQIKKLEKDLTAAFKENRFLDVKKFADQIKSSDPENHLAGRLLEKMEKMKTEQLKKTNAERVKELETRMKDAYKDGQLMEIAKIANEMKKIDPENKVLKKIEVQIDKAKAALDAQIKKEKIKGFEIVIKDMLKNEKWDDAVKKANDLIKLDQGNGMVLKAFKTAAKAKKVDIKTLIAATPLQSDSTDKKTVTPAVTQEKKPGFFAGLFRKKADEAPKTDLKKAEEIKKTVVNLSVKPTATAGIKNETKPTVIASVPGKKAEPDKAMKISAATKAEDVKPGFFAKLFKKHVQPALRATEGSGAEGKKDEPAKISTVSQNDGMKKIVMSSDAGKIQAKPADPVMAAKPAEKNPLTDKQKESEDKKAKEQKIKLLEVTLKDALKEKNDFSIKSAIEELKKADVNNKAAKKAEEKLADEKIKLEKESKKEKVGGLTKEIKALIKNEEWDKVTVKANELLSVEPENSFASDAIKKAAKAKNVAQTTLAKVSAPVTSETKPGLLSGLFGNKDKEVLKAPEKAMETAKPVAEMPVKTDVKEVQKAVIQSVPPVMPQPLTQKTESPKPANVITPATVIPQTVTPSAFNAPKPSMIKPTVPVKPPVTAFKPMVNQPAEQKAAETPSVQAPAQPLKVAENNPEKGNIFTKLFGKKAETEKSTGSIIETIVAQSVKEKKISREVVKKDSETGEGLLKFSNMFLRFSIVFMIIAAGFFYIFNIDESNMILNMAGKENNALILKNAAAELQKAEENKLKVEKEIDKYKKGYENEYKATIDKIIKDRMDWPDLIKKLNEVTESVYEKNALAQYVQYNNYSYDVEKGALTVSATLSDPLGKNLTKLAELEEAFTYYPKDKNDSNDKRKPYFQNLQEFRSYDKSFNKASGRYISNFTLSLSTKEQVSN